MNTSSNDLIALFQQALDEQWGYIYGASGQVWTHAKQNKATRTQTKKYGQQWVGRRVSDCSGLFYWAFKELGGSCYHGSNTIFKRYTIFPQADLYCTVRGNSFKDDLVFSQYPDMSTLSLIMTAPDMKARLQKDGSICLADLHAHGNGISE